MMNAALESLTKPAVYIETTIVSYLAARLSRDVLLNATQR